jgi:molecular chaperone DnaK (HSP70)
MAEVFLGIDLGTTTTLIGEAKDSRGPINVKVLNIRQKDGRNGTIDLNYLPSVAYLHPNGEFSVGLEAQVLGPEENPSRFVRAIKRQMGRPLILPEVNCLPYEISSLYIEKALTEGRYQLPMGEMVFTVTVPASFTSNQRADTLLALHKACEKVGITYPKQDEGQLFISEPVAAMLAFLNKEFELPESVRRLDFAQQNRVVVYDIGGGTLDLTMVFIDPIKKPVECLADLKIHVDSIGYYNPFGGEDFDRTLAEELYRRLMDQIPALQEVVLTPSQRLGVRLQFMNSAKKIKEAISKLMSQKDDADFLDELEDDPSHYYRDSIRILDKIYSLEGEITIAQYKEIVKDLVNGSSRKSLVTPLRDLLEKNQWDPNRLNGLLIVGGMGRLPLVEEALRSYWGNDKVWLYNPADHAVVTGAAIYSLLRRRYPGFTLVEPAADAYYVRLKDRFDLILPSRSIQGGETKEYVLDQDSDSILLQLFAGEEPEGKKPLESIYHTLIHQGGTSIPLGRTFSKNTPVWIQMRYESEEGQDHTKVPWVYVWVGTHTEEPMFRYRYSEFVQEAHHE